MFVGISPAFSQMTIALLIGKVITDGSHSGITYKLTHTHTYLYIYIDICVRVCVYFCYNLYLNHSFLNCAKWMEVGFGLKKAKFS